MLGIVGTVCLIALMLSGILSGIFGVAWGEPGLIALGMVGVCL